MKRLIAMGTVALCAAAFAGDFKAGFSRVDITPPLGVYMPGYYQARHAKEILDPLQINCVAFSDGKKTALIKGFRSNKTRRLFDAYLLLEKGKLKFDFPPREFKPRRFGKKKEA